MTHCVQCGEEYRLMEKTETASFNGGSLSVREVQFKTCACGTVMDLSDGALIDGYKLLLERSGIIGKVDVALGELKERYPHPMELLTPYVQGGNSN